MIGTFYMTGSVVAFVIPLPMSLPLLSALLLSLSIILCIIGISIATFKIYETAKKYFFLKTNRNDYDKMSYFTEQESTANLNLQ